MIVLDTHILVWWLSEDERLTKKAETAINNHIKKNDSILISSITTWEISMLVQKERLKLSMDVDSWLALVNSIEQIKFIPIDNKVAIESTRLPGEFHKDPADRMIVALARTLSAQLVTADQKIIDYKHVKTIV